MDLIQKMKQKQISYSKIDIYVISVKRDVAMWNPFFHVFSEKKIQINGPVVGGTTQFSALGGSLFYPITPNLACLMIRLKLKVKICKMALLVSRLKMIRLL